MTIPSMIFGLLIASLYGVLYHLARGGGLGRLLMFLIFAWTGFALGHLAGAWLEWVIIPVGELNLGMSSLGSLLLMVFGDLISRNIVAGPRARPGRDNSV